MTTSKQDADFLLVNDCLVEEEIDWISRKLYLVIEYDDHTDPQHQLFFDHEEALERAETLSKEYAEAYKHEVDVIKPSGSWLFCHQGEERWHIVVEEVTVT